ncbi:unnamed protein product [Lymnaea stagnalis]|uniref:Ig-like domain-containing protein n=1 Tax=Lymnaea stagnalis TaxID=6523 RepID=A0AAV2H4U8_LYMST
MNLFPLTMPGYIYDVHLYKIDLLLLCSARTYQNPVINERSWKAWLVHVGKIHVDEQTLVKLEVTNAQCSDSGIFTCSAFAVTHDLTLYWSISTAIDVIIKAPLAEFSFDVFTRTNKLDFVEGETIIMMCSIQGPKDVVFDWRFGRKQRNGEMLDYSYQHHRHIKTTVKPLSRPGFENCPYYEHRSQLSFTAERRYNGYTFYCDVLTPGTLFGRNNATIFVQTVNASETEVTHE